MDTQEKKNAIIQRVLSIPINSWSKSRTSTAEYEINLNHNIIIIYLFRPHSNMHAYIELVVEAKHSFIHAGSDVTEYYNKIKASEKKIDEEMEVNAVDHIFDILSRL